MIGLSKGNTNASYEDIDFAIYQCAWPSSRSTRAALSRGTSGPTRPATSSASPWSAESCKYSRNGTVFYTSTKAPTYPLLVDAALFTQGATLSSAVIAGAP